MNNIYKHKDIKTVVIEEEYYNGKNIPIQLNKEGITTNIKTLSQIKNLSQNSYEIKSVNDYYADFLNPLNKFENNDIELILGKNKSIEYLKYIKENISDVSRLITDYHVSYFKYRKETYNNLNPVKLDDLILDIPKYNHASTTGRTSIIEGFNFLTMKKEDRKRLKYSEEGYTLLEMDFKSCEPFFYLKTNLNINNDIKDVYEYIAGLINYEIKDRPSFKRGIISLMYGAANKSVTRLSGIKDSDVSKIKKVLKIEETKEFLEKEFKEKSVFFNYYGRPILKGNNVVNYWIQSSAVDFCSFAFGHFIKNNNVKPCFLIHDSITFAVLNDDVKKYLNLSYLTCPISKIKIPVKVEKLNDN